jgi:hypothetical protein
LARQLASSAWVGIAFVRCFVKSSLRAGEMIYPGGGSLPSGRCMRSRRSATPGSTLRAPERHRRAL